MNKYLIRFNKTKGQPGRGTMDHAWRVFENGKEFIVKHVIINVPCRDEITGDGRGNEDWNIACRGIMVLDKTTSTAIINEYKPTCNPL
jgi:hypothetical protein